ncbi:MAG TPA: response regulator transcription factor [Marmoricola sp.]|nr:response regulator transcription factor [Marmoricola sp.]
MTSVLIADDQVLVRDGFRAIIEREPDLDVVGEAGDGVEAVEVVDRLRPDVVLMDIRMPRVDGLQATRLLMARRQPPRILVLTTFDRNDWVYDALRAGASGFLLKDVRAGQLTEAIRTVAAGEVLLAPAITRRFIEDHLDRHGMPAADPRVAGLSTRETEVLRYIARGLSNEEIAKALFLGVSTVKTHVNRLLTKLDLRDRTQAAVFAYENGLVRPGDTAGTL